MDVLCIKWVMKIELCVWSKWLVFGDDVEMNCGLVNNFGGEDLCCGQKNQILEY